MTNNNSKVLRISFGIVIFLFFYYLSGPLEFFGLQNRVATLMAYAFLFIAIFTAKSRILLELSLSRSLFLIYLLLKFATYPVLYNTNLLQPFVAFAELFLWILLLQLSDDIALSSRINISNYFTFSIVWFTIVSIIQYYNLGVLSDIFSNYGGNINSGRLLMGGILVPRVNAGIGGTVIDFACTLILLGYINLFLKQKKATKIINTILLSVLVVTSFSRIVLISVSFILLSWIILFLRSRQKLERFVIILFVIVSLILVIMFAENLLFSFFEDLFTSTQEEVRISSWLMSFNTSSLLIGGDLGRNTGFPVDQVKVVADGLFFGIFYDTGIIGLILYILLIFEPLMKIARESKRENRWFIYIVILNVVIMNIMNSGFNYHINAVFYFFLVLSIKQFTSSQYTHI